MEKTYTLSEGVQDLQTVVVLFTITEVMERKVRPVPGLPLAFTDEVAHPGPIRFHAQHLALCSKIFAPPTDQQIIVRNGLFLLSESDIMWVLEFL